MIKKKTLLFILLFSMIYLPIYPHHNSKDILDALVSQSVKNYFLSVECVNLLDQSIIFK